MPCNNHNDTTLNALEFPSSNIVRSDEAVSRALSTIVAAFRIRKNACSRQKLVDDAREIKQRPRPSAAAKQKSGPMLGTDGWCQARDTATGELCIWQTDPKDKGSRSLLGHMTAVTLGHSDMNGHGPPHQ
jgi:hypothetical protein